MLTPNVRRDLFNWILVRPRERLYEPLQVYLVALGSMFGATASAMDPESCVVLSSSRLNVSLLVPVVRPVRAALGDHLLGDIEIGVGAAMDPVMEGLVTSGFAPYLRSIRMSLVIAVVDRCLKWIDANFGSNVGEHPEMLRFCRTIRNAAAHGGVVNIRNLRSPVASWRGLELGPKSNGLQIFHTELGDADALLLMMDLSSYLDEAGAPP